MLKSTHDNWEKLVDAVLKRELFIRLCHQDSRASSSFRSISSASSFNSSFSRSSFSFHESQQFKSANSIPFRLLFKTKQEHGQLMFPDNSPFTFGLKELLSAPSTVLGDEIDTYNTTYLVSLSRDLWLVVKRFNIDSATRRNVEKRLKLFSGIEHENVVKLRAYYVSENEAFGIFDYLFRESVYAMLHGSRGVPQFYLNWDARTKVAIGAAKGLAHIHSITNGKICHGNVKATSIFLNTKNHGCIGDQSISNFQPSRYQPPEVSEKGVSQESDVYSFGVLLIELISGKSPVLFRGRHRTYADWVLHNARDEMSALVYDKQLLKDPLAKQEISTMFEVAKQCLDKEPEKRPEMKDVVMMLEFLDTY